MTWKAGIGDCKMASGGRAGWQRSAVMFLLKYPVSVITLALWISTFLYSSRFGVYEDDWYYFIAPHGAPILAGLRQRLSQLFDLGRPLQELSGVALSVLGVWLNNLAVLYFMTFLLSAVKGALAYRVLRLRYHFWIAFLATLLFVISPLTTIRQFLNGEPTVALAYIFVFAAILTYAKYYRPLSYVLAALALLTYEPFYLLFLAAPLFVQSPNHRERRRQLIWHLAPWAIVLVSVFWLRVRVGEHRAPGVQLSLSTLARIVDYDVYYSIASFQSYLYGVYVGITNASLDAWLWTGCIVLPLLIAVVWRLAYSPLRANPAKNFRPLLDAMLLGILLTFLSFGFAYFHLSQARSWPLAGRDTRVASAATFGSSLFVASLIVFAIKMARKRWLKLLAATAAVSFMGSLFLYSFVVQDDYVRVWEHDRSILSQIVMMTPDIREDNLIVVRDQPIEQLLFPGPVRMPSIGYQKHGLRDGFRCLTSWQPWPRMAFLDAQGWKEHLKPDKDGAWRWVQDPMQDLRNVIPGRIILFSELPGGRLLRADRQAMLDGKPALQLLEPSATVSRPSRWSTMRTPIMDSVLDPITRSAMMLNTVDPTRETYAGEPTLIPDPQLSSDSIVLKATEFSSGNVRVDTTLFGIEIGVIVSTAANPAVAEYKFSVPMARRYQAMIQCASDEPRPLNMFINGVSASTEACALTTGGWDPWHQAWQSIGIINLNAGSNTVRFVRDGAFPHVHKIAFKPYAGR